MTRRRFTEMDVILTLIRQFVTIPCYRCKIAFTTLDATRKNIEREHYLEIALGGDDAPHNCVYSHKACHAVVTNGTKATTAGSSKHRIAKTARLAAGGKKRKGRAIPSRPFPQQQRKFGS